MIRLKATLYLFIVYFVTFFLPKDWYLFKAVIGLPVAIIFPYLLGQIIFENGFFKLKIDSSLLRVFLYWSAGLMSLTLLVYLTSTLLFFNWLILIVISLILIVFYQLIKFKQNNFVQLRIFFDYKKNIHLVIIILAVFLIATFIRSYSPFPLQSGGDNIFLGGLASEIMQNDFTNSNFYTYSYLPFIPIILAFVSTLSHVEPIHVLWLMPYLTYFVFGLGLYKLLRKKTGDRTSSLLVAILFIFIIGYKSRIIDIYNFRTKCLFYILIPYLLMFIHYYVDLAKKNYTNTIRRSLALLLPSLFFSITTLILGMSFSYSLIALMLVLVGYLLIRKNITEPVIPVLFFLSLFFSFIHPFTGIFMILALVFTGILQIVVKNKLLTASKIVVFTLLLIATYFIYSKNLPSALVDTPDSENIIFGGIYNYDFTVKRMMLIESVGLPLLALSLLGALWKIKKYKPDSSHYVYGYLITFLMIFLPINFGYRLIENFIPFLAIFVAFGVLAVKKVMFSPIFLRKGFIGFFLLIFLVILYSPQIYINSVFAGGQADKEIGFTNYIQEEYEAALWVKENYPANTLIFTQPDFTRSFTAISGKTLMLRSTTYEYRYRLTYKLSAEAGRCKQILVNNRFLNTNSIFRKGNKNEIYFETVIKDHLEDKTNKIEFRQCNLAEIKDVSLLYGDDEILPLEGSEDQDEVIYYFTDAPSALKSYPLAIFDTIADLKELRRQIFAQTDSQKSYEAARSLSQYYLSGLKDQLTRKRYQKMHTLIVVSGPAARWSINQQEGRLLATPFVYFDGFEKFKDSHYFREVYAVSGKVYIYELIE